MVWEIIAVKVALSLDHRFVWMDADLVDVADRRQNNSDIWRPYAVSGPAHQLRTCACSPRRRPGRSGRVHFLSPLSHAPEALPQRSRRRELTPASSSALLAASLPTKTRPQLRRDLLSNLHLQTRRETLRWADISNFSQIGSPWPFSPANSMLSSSERLVFSG